MVILSLKTKLVKQNFERKKNCKKIYLGEDTPREFVDFMTYSREVHFLPRKQICTFVQLASMLEH